MNLYDLADEFQKIESALIDAEGELTPEIEDALASLQQQTAAKLEGLAMVIQRLTRQSEAAKAEADRLAQLAKVRANGADRLRRYVLGWMEANDRPRVETDRFVLRVQQNSVPSVRVDDPDGLPPEYQRVRFEPDNAALLAQWKKDPFELPVGVTVEYGRHLRIK